MTVPNSSAPPSRLSVLKGEREESPPATDKLFFNRELSWLAFNERVLDEARDRLAAALRAAEVPRHRLPRTSTSSS